MNGISWQYETSRDNGVQIVITGEIGLITKLVNKTRNAGNLNGLSKSVAKELRREFPEKFNGRAATAEDGAYIGAGVRE